LFKGLWRWRGSQHIIIYMIWLRRLCQIKSSFIASIWSSWSVIKHAMGLVAGSDSHSEDLYWTKMEIYDYWFTNILLRFIVRLTTPNRLMVWDSLMVQIHLSWPVCMSLLELLFFIRSSYNIIRLLASNFNFLFYLYHRKSFLSEISSSVVDALFMCLMC